MSTSILDHPLSGRVLAAAEKWLNTLDDPQGITALQLLELVGRNGYGQADRAVSIEQSLAMLSAGGDAAAAAFMLLHATIALERLDAIVCALGGRLEFEQSFKQALLSGKPLAGLIRVKWSEESQAVRQHLEDEEGGAS